MNIKKDDLKTLIVIAIVCVVCIVIALILNIQNNVDGLEPVSEYNVFFANTNYVNNYIKYITSGDSEGVYKLLDSKYIEDNSIDYYNVLDKVSNYSGDCTIKVISMDYVQVGSNFIYYIKANVYDNGYDTVEIMDDNFSVVLISDFDNLSYSLYPVDDNNYKKVINGIKKINISSNDYNAITQSELINKEQICVFYLTDFFDRIVNDIDSSYDLLSNDMKEIYTSVDSYKNYMNNYISTFYGTADRCRMDDYDDVRVYTVIDNNDNTYIFTEEHIMDYKVDFYFKEVNE